MKDARKLIIVAIVLILLPGVLRFISFNRGGYDPGELPEIDDSNIIDVLPEYTTYTDEPADGGGIVIFDMSHRNNTTINDLTPLRDRITNRGVELMDFDSDSGFQTSALRGASALVIVSPTTSYSDDEIEAILDFAEDGGRVLLVADPTRTADLDVGGDLYTALFPESAIPAINSVANAFDISYVDDYLYNIIRNEGNYRNVILRNFEGENALTEGIDTLVMFAAHSLRSDGVALATGDSNTFSPVRTGETGLSPIVLSQDGQALALGDLTFLTPPFHTMADNDHFLSNIADWLATAERDWDITDFPYLFGRPVDLIPVSSGPVDPQLILMVNALGNVIEDAGLSIGLSAEAWEGHDSLLVGTYSDADEVDAILTSAQIDLSDSDIIESDLLGDFSTEGTSLFVTSQTDSSVQVVVLAEDDDAVIDALNLLIRADFSDCVQGRAVTICSTGIRSNEISTSDVDEDDDDIIAADTPCSDLATTVPIAEGYPRLGSQEETLCMLENGLVDWLSAYSEDAYPDSEFEAGDVYFYTIEIDKSIGMLWDWGWCASGEQLEQNWEHITLSFFLNELEIPLSDFVMEESGDEDFACRNYYILVTDWPDGYHLLVTEIYFDTELDDGYSVYDEGYRTYYYDVYVGG